MIERFLEFMIQQLNGIFPILNTHKELEKAKTNNEYNQFWAYEEAMRISKHINSYLEYTSGKKTLDIGVGLGGKLRYYNIFTPSQLVGIDINLNSLQIAKSYVETLPYDNIYLVNSDASFLPFPTSFFDFIISINTYEHIDSPEQALKEIYRVVKPNGFVLLFFPPFYSPWGAHLENLIHFPWPHIIFPEKLLVKVALLEYEKHQLNFLPSAKLLYNKKTMRIEGLNRITIKKLKNLIADSNFKLVELKFLPVGYHYLSKKDSFLSHISLWLLRYFCKIPLLQELIVTKIICVLRK